MYNLRMVAGIHTEGSFVNTDYNLRDQEELQASRLDQ